MADTTTELEVLDEIVDVLGGVSHQHDTVVPVLEDIRDLLGGGGGGGGYNPSLSVGRADALTGADSTAQWAQRESTGSGAATVRSVQGAAVAFNQLNRNNTDTSESNGVTFTKNGDGSWTLNGTATANASKAFDSGASLVPQHKYLVSGCPSGGSANTYFMGFDGLDIDFGSGGIWTNPSYPSSNLRIDIKSGESFDNVTIWPQYYDLTAMFGAGNEPTTVAEFEAMYPEAYYPYSAPTLKPVQIAGIKSVGFNQWDEEWELGSIGFNTGKNQNSNSNIRSKNYIPVIPEDTYYLHCASLTSASDIVVFFYDASKNWLGATAGRKYWANQSIAIPKDARYARFYIGSVYGTTYKHDICVNLSDPALNGRYKPYKSDAIEWPTKTLRAAGSVADMLYSDHVDVRVGERAYQSGDESDATVRTDGTTTYYPLTTPTTQPISPALPMTYRVEQGGSESIIVPDGEVSAAPVLTIAEGESAADVVMDALACIAAPDGPTATANHAINTYLTMQGKLYKVTSAIAVGETIKSGTNVSQTTVMAELIARTA